MNGKIILGLVSAGLSIQIASASAILETYQQFSGTGLGAVPTILTYQNNGSEVGCIGLNGSIGASYDATGACTGTGNDKTGSSQTQLQALSAANIVGGTGSTAATAAADFGLIYNAVQPAGGALTVDNVTIAFYNSTGTTLLYETTGFECMMTSGGPVTAGPCNLTTTAQGTGNSGYLVTLDSAQRAAAIAAGAFSSSSNLVGVSSSAGTGANAAAGGAETIFLANTGSAVVTGGQTPEPGTWILLASGLGLIGLARVRRAKLMR